MLELRTLGTIDLRGDDGQPIAAVIQHARRASLLAYLCAAHPPLTHRRDTLVALLWPDLDQPHARGALRQELHQLRHAVGASVLLGEGEEALGVDGSRLWCDARAFEAALDANDLAGGLTLYRGEFLPGLHVHGGALERWLDDARAHFSRRAVSAARILAHAAEAEGDVDRAISWTQRLIEIAPYDETAWQRLMSLLDRSGDRAGAVVAHDSLATLLRNELDVMPSPETEALFARIRCR